MNMSQKIEEKRNDEHKLTAKQKRFCEEYLLDFNATKAAIRSGYSQKTAYAIGEQNLKKLEIRKFIEKAQSSTSKRNNITAAYLIELNQNLIHDDIKNYIVFKKVKSRMKTFLRPDIEKIDTKNIQQISFYPSGEVKIRLYSKDVAKDALSRHIGFYNDVITIKNNIEEILKDLTESGKLTEEHLIKIVQLILDQQKKFSHVKSGK
jgi:phage terminase small subunit